ncbi:phenoloxidase-activating factor 2-like isoform X1 [Drosophila takahashii]|uniref:phenoloxidase-activating factor 2-like isoform X1 n=2 Tax=Drosophila takahashii TaxID=29030 RepID=UPI003898DE15
MACSENINCSDGSQVLFTSHFINPTIDENRNIIQKLKCNMILLNFLILCACILTCGAQNTSVDNLIAEIFRTGDTRSSIGPITSNANPGSVQIESCGYQKECVRRWLCKSGTINTNGEGLIDIRIGSGSQCKNYMDLCCDLSNKSVDPIFPIAPDNPKGCGYKNSNGVGFKIIGAVNQEAEFGEFPWMLAILREEGPRNVYECGGALIAPNVVLTAAHCARNKERSSIVVRAGEWDTQITQEIIGHEDRHVKEIVYHEQFNKGALYNDIALMLLESPFSSKPNIQPVCLPNVGENFDFDRCYATGWGKNQFGKDGEYQVILKKVDMPVVPAQQCQANLRETRLGRHFILHDSFICAGGEKDKDTCKGDGGSPLVCPIKGQKDRFVSAGIISWGVLCGEENIPGLYANVAYLRPWIDAKLQNWNIDPTYYTP